MRKKSYRHWSWLEFSEAHLVSGQDRTHRIPGTPCVDIIAVNGGDILEIRVHAPARDPIPREIASMARITVTGGGDYLSISTSSQTLYPEFYHMAVLISDRVQIRGEEPLNAVGEVLSDIRRLTAVNKPLSDSEEIGLFGELWVLKRFIMDFGPDAVKAWIGAAKREHDFRFGNVELEVKTTSRVRRVHTIHGLGQLVASPGKTLLLLSIHISPAGAGKGDSLMGLRREIQGILKKNPATLAAFSANLDAFGLKEKDWSLYKRPWELRAPAALIKSGRCPSINHDHLRKFLSADHSSRVENVDYEINVEGLGCGDGTAEFSRLYESLKEGIAND